MLLVIDVGNTQTVVGLYDSGDRSHQLLDHWRMATSAERTSDELRAVHPTPARDPGPGPGAPTSRGVAVSSGVPSITYELRRMCERYLSVEPVILGTGVKTGMPVLYDNPREVGADRIANAVGAFDLYGGPTIVVDFGTATTFDVISDEGRVPRRSDLPRDRDLHGRAVRPGRRAAPGGAERAAQRHRQDHDGVGPVRCGLRLLGDGRRDVRPHRGGHRRVDHHRDRRAGIADRPGRRVRSSTRSRG